MTYPLPPTFINDTTQGGTGAVSAQNLNDYTAAITGLDGRSSTLEARAPVDATGSGAQYRLVVLPNGTLIAVPASTTFPSAPTGLVASIHLSFITLNWGTVTGATSYQLYRNGTLLTTVTGTTYSDGNGITVSSTYTYYVVAVNAYGMWSPHSLTISAFVDPALNSAPVFESITVWPANPNATDVVYVHINGHDVDAQQLTFALTTSVGTLTPVPNDPTTWTWAGS